MKKILILLTLLISNNCFGQFNHNIQRPFSSVQLPDVTFKSVNTCIPCVNYRPNIISVYSDDINQVEQQNYYRIRRVGRDDDPGDPFATPIGDIPWLLILLFIGLYVIKIKWKTIKSST